jgi:hypothetical protein
VTNASNAGSEANPDLASARENWYAAAMAHQNSAGEGFQISRYFDLVRQHAIEGVNHYKSLLFFALPLAVQAERLVELGSSFSYYPETYADGSPWGVSSDRNEGVVSTRIMLSACRLLNRLGVPARLTSIDIRTSADLYAAVGRDLVASARSLIEDLDLSQFWDLHEGTDTVAWLHEETERFLRGEAKPIDFVLVDSNHTYDQVSRELEAVLPLLSRWAVILVDDCYETNYVHGATWIPEESREGVLRGGEYGAVLEFLQAHPEWRADWMPFNVLLSRDVEHLPKRPA